SSFDTLLGVYTGPSVSALTQVAANDDNSSSDVTSRVSFSAAAGTVYRIAVDGYRNGTPSQGSVTLTWSEAVAPANDAFESAAVLAVSGTTSGSNAGATKAPGEPNHAGNAGGSSVW